MAKRKTKKAGVGKTLKRHRGKIAAAALAAAAIGAGVYSQRRRGGATSQAEFERGINWESTANRFNATKRGGNTSSQLMKTSGQQTYDWQSTASRYNATKRRR